MLARYESYLSRKGVEGESCPLALFPEAGRAILYPAYRQTPSVVSITRVLFQDGSYSELAMYRFLNDILKYRSKPLNFNIKKIENRESFYQCRILKFNKVILKSSIAIE